MSTSFAIRADGISKSYGNCHAVRNLSLQIHSCKMTGITGPSGSGKTTLLQILGGLLAPDTGEVTIHGTNINALRDRQRTIFRRRHTAFVFQDFNLLPNLTAKENILLPLLLAHQGTTDAEERLATLLETLGLAAVANRFPEQMSGGEQQRTAIARALISDAEECILFADEPTGSLDSRTGETLCKLLRSLVDEQGRTVLVVTHSPQVIKYCDTVLRLRDGAIQQPQHTSTRPSK